MQCSRGEFSYRVDEHWVWCYSSIFLVGMFLLASCSIYPSASYSATEKTRSAMTVGASSVTQTPGAIDANDGGDSKQFRDQYLQMRHQMAYKFAGPDGWTWHTTLPAHRLVLFYGNPLTPVMGPIGQYSDHMLITKLHEQAQIYQNLDPSHPVVPALDYVTPVVQSVPMADQSWVYRMPDASVEHYIDLANSNHALFFFDMQVGHSSVQKEVQNVWKYLERPGVELSLDPEFDLPPGAIPDQVFGRMTANEINRAINQLSQLVVSKNLPPKILIIHQFLRQMLPDWQKIRPQPGVEVITCVDGFGSPGAKMDDYRVFDSQQLIQYPGIKLFHRLDTPIMTPKETLALNPSPLMVMYQ